MAQEVELKSQISLLEKKVHDNWVMARQAERRLEDAKQEAAQLRNRLTLRERAYSEDKNSKFLNCLHTEMSQRKFGCVGIYSKKKIEYSMFSSRLVFLGIQSPVGQNGDLLASPLHLAPVESPASPPLLYGGGREHMTTSPPIPLHHPFLPPPPPPPFMPPFMPPLPPAMFPGDHRPPPLGRMSSPPDSRPYSPYDDEDDDGNSPYDSEYGAPSPAHIGHHHHSRGYSPFNGKEEDRRRQMKGGRGNRNQGEEWGG